MRLRTVIWLLLLASLAGGSGCRSGDGYILSDAELTGDGGLVFSLTDRGSIQDHRPRPLLAVRFDDRTESFGEPRTLGSALFVGAPQLARDDSPESPHRGRLYSVRGCASDLRKFHCRECS